MNRYHTLLTAIAATALTGAASASPVAIQSQDLLNQCDPLAPLPAIMDELGTVVFPNDELISATATTAQGDVCPASNPTIPNQVLLITNLTSVSFTDLHYVADPFTTFSNVDGLINGHDAVKIDNVGVNRPLILELGGSQPLVFEPGEIWEFSLDDWGNAAGFAVTDLASIGVPSAFGLGQSTGSIVANILPEPGTIVLLALGATTLIRRNRSNR